MYAYVESHEDRACNGFDAYGARSCAGDLRMQTGTRARRSTVAFVRSDRDGGPERDDGPERYAAPERDGTRERAFATPTASVSSSRPRHAGQRRRG